MSNTRNISQDELAQQYAKIEQVKCLLKSRFGERAPKAFTHTYGCQGNVAEGERIDGLLSKMGYEFKS